MIVGVDVEIGPDGDPVPRRLRMGRQPIDVVEILDRWPGADHLYVKLEAADGALYILRHDTARGTWELTMFDAGRHDVASGRTGSPPRKPGRD